MLGTIFRAIWWVLTLPFRVVFTLIELFGRLAAFVLGFALMVVGVALGAGLSLVVGVPVFVVGLVVTLRALG